MVRSYHEEKEFIFVRHFNEKFDVQDTWIQPKEKMVFYDSKGATFFDGLALTGKDKQGNKVTIPLRSIIRINPEHVMTAKPGSDFSRELPRILNEGLAATGWRGCTAHPDQPMWLDDNKVAFNILDENSMTDFGFYVVTVEGKVEGAD